MPMLVSEIDLDPCYRVTISAANWIVRCRLCSAGWLPLPTSPAGPLVRHARMHRLRLLPLITRLHSGMPIKVPSDVKPIRDCRLDLIRVVSMLHDRVVDGEDSLKSKVKASMQNKGAAFATGEMAIAALRAGSARGTIDPRRLHKMVDNGKLTMSQFLSCVTIRRKPLEEFISGAEIDRITTSAGEASPSLVVELKPGAEIDFDRLTEIILAAIGDGACVAKSHTDAA